jgi:hypothetical protein
LALAQPVFAQPAEAPDAPALPVAEAPPPAADGKAAGSAEEPGSPSDSEAPVDADQAASDAEYSRVVAQAIDEFDAGRWEEARALFLRAHELKPGARTLRTLGMTSFELRQYPRALSELSAALTDERRPLDARQREHVESLIERAKQFVGRYRLKVEPASASVLVDGAAYLPGQEEFLQLGVGRHEVIARAPDHAELRRRLDVQGGEERDLVLTLTPASAPVVARNPEPAPPAATEPVEDSSTKPKRLWTWVAGGTSVALAATSTGLWLASDAQFQQQKQDCEARQMTPNYCDPENPEPTNKIEKLQTAHHITAGLAIATGVAAVALYVIEGDVFGRKTTIGLGPSRVTLGTQF